MLKCPKLFGGACWGSGGQGSFTIILYASYLPLVGSVDVQVIEKQNIKTFMLSYFDVLLLKFDIGSFVSGKL